MKNLVVAGVVLLIVYAGPQRGEADVAHALWAMGLLVITAYTLQQLTRWLRLPDPVAWVAAGLVLGATGLRVISPQGLPQLALLTGMTGAWVGFRVGTHFWLPVSFGWHGALRLGAGTLATATLVTLGIILVAAPPWWLALLLGVAASLWDPFTTVPGPARRDAVSVASIGTGVALVLLSGVLVILGQQRLVSAAAPVWVVRLWLALLAGALVAIPFRYTVLSGVRRSTLAVGLISLLVAMALLIHGLALFALPCGFGAGLVLSRQRVSGRRLRFLLHSVSPLAFMLFLALLGARLDVRGLWPLRPQVVGIVAVQALVLAAARMLLSPYLRYMPIAERSMWRQFGWLLLPRGALLFGLVFHPQHGLQSLLGAEAAQLLAQVVTADLLVHLMVFTTFSHVARYWRPLVSTPAVAGTSATLPVPE